MREEYRAGIQSLEEVTTLLRRVRAAHPTAGVYEAADFQWRWRKPRSTDTFPQLFWYDHRGQPEAAVIATDEVDAISLDPILMPDANPDRIDHVVERGLVHATVSGSDVFDFVVDRADDAMIEVLAGRGFTRIEDEMVDSWLPAGARPEISILPSDYRLADRRDMVSVPHHMTARNGPDVEERLRQTQLYRPDLDLVVLDSDDRVASYGLFWFDPETATGLVEPMRTEDNHQGRGLGRHVLTTGINLVFDAGATRIKIAWEPHNLPAHTLYTSIGFNTTRKCARVSRSG